MAYLTVQGIDRKAEMGSAAVVSWFNKLKTFVVANKLDGITLTRSELKNLKDTTGTISEDVEVVVEKWSSTSP